MTDYSSTSVLASALELKKSYLALCFEVEAEPGQFERLLKFSRQAAASGHFELASNALFVAAMARSSMGEVHQALDLIRQASRCIPTPSPALGGKEVFYRALVLKDAGDHTASVVDLSRLVKGPHFRHIPLPMRVDVFRHLADLCGGVYAHDAVLCCWEQAQWECNAAQQPMPNAHRMLRAMSMLDGHLFDGTPLAGLPLLDAVDHRVRPESDSMLSQAESDLRAALGQDDGSLRGARSGMAAALLAMVDVLRQPNEHAARACLDLVRQVDRRNPYAELRLHTRLLATLLKAGCWAQAGSLSAGELALDLERLLPIERLRWRYLRAATAKACRGIETAYTLYAIYAQDHAACIARMNLRAADVLAMLTARAGSRPTDSAQRRPAYLDAALGCIRSSSARLRIADVARMVGVSERTLREAFVVHEGVSPKEFELAERLDKALHHVRINAQGSSESLELLAQRFGFSNARRFATLFRKRHGFSVSQAQAQAAELGRR
jgi:AraC-like DNA-binding protein